MLTEPDMIETINYYRAGDDDKLLELFQRFDSYDWETPECNEWKSTMPRNSLILFNTLFRYCHQNIHPWTLKKYMAKGVRWR